MERSKFLPGSWGLNKAEMDGSPDREVLVARCEIGRRRSCRGRRTSRKSAFPPPCRSVWRLVWRGPSSPLSTSTPPSTLIGPVKCSKRLRGCQQYCQDAVSTAIADQKWCRSNCWIYDHFEIPLILILFSDPISQDLFFIVPQYRHWYIICLRLLGDDWQSVR